MLYKEDWKKLKKQREANIEGAKRSIELDEILLEAIIAQFEKAKPNPNIVDVGGIAKVKLVEGTGGVVPKKPTGVG